MIYKRFWKEANNHAARHGNPKLHGVYGLDLGPQRHLWRLKCQSRRFTFLPAVLSLGKNKSGAILCFVFKFPKNKSEIGFHGSPRIAFPFDGPAQVTNPERSCRNSLPPAQARLRPL